MESCPTPTTSGSSLWPKRSRLSTYPPIKGLIENTLIDWEGRIAAIIFLPGCNLRCRYCHSPHLLNPPPDLETIPVQAVVDLINKSEGWLDGVVVTGGEPLLHHNLRNLLITLRDAGVGIKLDTNGTSPDALASLTNEGLIDSVAMDVKAPLRREKYEEIVGVDCDINAIARTIQLLLSGTVDYEFRVTVCPSFTNADDIIEIARCVAGARRLVLQPFRPNNCLDASLLDVKPLTNEALREYAEQAAPHVQNCLVRGDPKSAPKL